jgi:hypothetical protein
MVVIDKPWWFARNPNRTPTDLYLDAFEQLVSRFDLFLRRRHADGHSSKGLIIADPCSSALCGALKSSLLEFQKAGTKWAQVYNIVESVLFLGSHESPGLQVADLCSYAVWRLVEFGDDQLIVRLRDAFDREPLSAAVNPGKWHGVKYLGGTPVVEGILENVWPAPARPAATGAMKP